MIEDIEDDYPTYVTDELGYAWDAWEIVTSDEMRRHDELLAASADELSQIDPGTLDDLSRWAYARRARELQGEDAFIDVARLVLGSTAEGAGTAHPALDYAEVHYAVAASLANVGALDEAAVVVSAATTSWPDDSDLRRLDVCIAVRSRPEVAAARVEKFVDDHAGDAELLFELAEDLAGMGMVELAGVALDACQVAATGTSTMIDVELLREELAALVRG